MGIGSGLRASAFGRWRALLRTIGIGMLVTVGGLVPVAPTEAATVQIPLGVSADVLKPEPTGPVVATGRLTDAKGRPTAGSVAVLAWPSVDMRASMKVGDTFTTPTIGWGRASKKGAFSVRVDPARIPAGYRAANNQLDLVVVAWNKDWEGTSVQSTDVDTKKEPSASFVAANRTRFKASADANLSSGVATNVKVSLGTPLSKPHKSAAPSSGVQPMAVFPPNPEAIGCVWTLKAITTQWVDYGETYTYWASARAHWSTSHSLTTGFAMNVSPSWGGFKTSGSTTETSGITITPDFYPYSRVWQIGMDYGKYLETCGYPSYPYDVKWAFGALSASGDFKTDVQAQPSNDAYAIWVCPPRGGSVTWSRSDTSSQGYSTSWNIETSSLIGYKLGFTSSWSASSSYARDVEYKASRSIILAGNNAKPPSAGRIYELFSPANWSCSV